VANGVKLELDLVAKYVKIYGVYHVTRHAIKVHVLAMLRVSFDIQALACGTLERDVLLMLSFSQHFQS